jgi:hypothetical protein
VYVIGLNLQSDHATLERLDLLANQFVQALGNRTGQDWAAILGTPRAAFLWVAQATFSTNVRRCQEQDRERVR